MDYALQFCTSCHTVSGLITAFVKDFIPRSVNKWQFMRAWMDWELYSVFHKNLTATQPALHPLQTSKAVRRPRPVVSIIHIPPLISPLARSDVKVMTPHQSISMKALIDSGFAGNFNGCSNFYPSFNFIRNPISSSPRAFDPGKTVGPWLYLSLHSHRGASCLMPAWE